MHLFCWPVCVFSIRAESWSFPVQKQHVRPFKWGPKIQISLRFTDVVNQSCCRRSSDHDQMCSRGPSGIRDIPSKYHQSKTYFNIFMSLSTVLYNYRPFHETVVTTSFSQYCYLQLFFRAMTYNNGRKKP